ncbi:hypothetical protein [Nonomuraea wenchangensis]|uniref:Uncharacterized protein n=1 Tax=Nonomuraea wenchangensis TaxID=568860 RepID=A0A1I0LVA6_9ACTN|nr:hypothetical protein [Nonomuraea wenchangensis]SEU46453.1 hypothetical protein SAMN05421811_12738 [Nonomuraea wenchangensis]
MADPRRENIPEVARELVPFMEAGRRGLAAANWRVGMEADDLVAPVVLAVIAEVHRRVVEGGTLDERALAAGGLMVVPVELLQALTDDEECDFDHHGGCQTHGYLSLEPDERCPQAEARELLAAATNHHNEEDQNRHA